MNLRNTATAGLLLAVSLTLPAQAALQARDLNNDTVIDAYYDTELDLTWLQNANLAASETFGVLDIYVGGLMRWATAESWILAMNTNNYLGYSGWMLPTALNQDGSGPCMNYNCTSSPMGALFYNAGGLKLGDSILDSSILKNHFINMQSSHKYWTSTEYSLTYAWGFYTKGGSQMADSKEYLGYAWAVRPGDITAPVPEPETYALLLAGLGLVGIAARRRKVRLSCCSTHEGVKP